MAMTQKVNDSSQTGAGLGHLDRIQFLLGHIEGFIDDETERLREACEGFTAQTGLEHIEHLIAVSPAQPALASLVLENLVPFFESGLLIQRSPCAEEANWWVTDLFGRGLMFQLPLKEQIRANPLVPEITPLQVQRAAATKILDTLKLPFLAPSQEANGYILRPTPTTAFILVSNLPDIWAADHIAQAQRLVNKSFLY